MAELLKGLYVEVTDREFTVADKRNTDSRVSLLTGIHRKDVKRLRAEPSTSGHTPRAVSLGLRLVNAWLTPPFADLDGKAKPLPRLASKGGEISFNGLVASVSKDIRARAVLDEWERLGTVTVDDTDRVVLTDDAFVPRQGFDELAYFYGLNLHDHAAAAASNLMGNRAPFLERSIHYQRISPALLAELRHDAEGGGMQLLKTMNRKVQDVPAPATGEEARRFTFGIYFYSEATPEPGTPTDSTDSTDDKDNARP